MYNKVNGSVYSQSFFFGSSATPFVDSLPINFLSPLLEHIILLDTFATAQEQRHMKHGFAKGQVYLMSLMISGGTGVTLNGLPMDSSTLFNSSCFYPYKIGSKLGGYEDIAESHIDVENRRTLHFLEGLPVLEAKSTNLVQFSLPQILCFSRTWFSTLPSLHSQSHSKL